MLDSIPVSEVRVIYLACEAGMGSSVMSVNALKKMIKKAGVEGVKVVHTAAREIPEDAKLVVVHKGLAKYVRTKVPNGVVVSFSPIPERSRFQSPGSKVRGWRRHRGDQGLSR